MKTIREIVIEHAQSALEILEHERIDNHLGDEPTSGQEVVDYLREKPDHLFDEGEEAALFYAAPDMAAALAALVAADTAICENIGLKSDQAMQRLAALTTVDDIGAKRAAA